jgi:spore germination cell wall hydrolase CwlJ-like protein
LRYETFAVWQECYQVAKDVMEGKVADPTGGATHYYSGKKKPMWASQLTHLGDIGGFHFYAE